MGALWDALIAGSWFAGEMTFGLWFLLGAVVLVPLAIIAGLSEIADSEYRNDSRGGRIVWSLVLFGGMLFLLQWGGIPLLHSVKEHGLYTLLGLVGFVMIGALWSVYKFNIFAETSKEELRKFVEKFCKEHRLDPNVVLKDCGKKLSFSLREDLRQGWRDYFAHYAHYAGLRIIASGATADLPMVTFRNNKERITLWVLFWPSSMLRGLFKDILARALDALISSLRGVYESIARRHAIEVIYTPSSPDQENNVEELRPRKSGSRD